VLDGVSDSEIEFLGFANIINSMNDFQAEQSNIKSDGMASQFDLIVSAKLTEETKPFEESLKSFHAANKGTP
jgi:hypothetical protein